MAICTKEYFNSYEPCRNRRNVESKAAVPSFNPGGYGGIMQYQ
jgi:hypothetical protein